MTTFKRTAAVFLTLLIGWSDLHAAEYFVSRRGDKANDGLSRERAFLTIQQGVNALQPGDTLTIAPGEYFENVRRNKLGSEEAETIIRAEIPGTVVLRGDVPAPAFRKLDGHRFVYVADFDAAGAVPAVNELDTLKILSNTPNATEPEFLPGTFHFDRTAKKLYISPSDMRPAASHRYSVAVIPTHGFYLSDPRRVVIDSLAVTGFNGLSEAANSERTLKGVWGMFLSGGKRCIIRDCRAWLNGWGIGSNSEKAGSGDNVIERCVAWGNNSQFKGGDMGGLTLFGARRDVIRNSKAFLNGMYGINIYGTGTDGGTYGSANLPGNEDANKSVMVNNLAWGNWCDFKIKTGVKYFHRAESCAGPGKWSIDRGNVIRSLIGDNKEECSKESIELAKNKKIDLRGEFADPDHHDYRLQATSQFRGAAPDGMDAGSHPYRENIFYVRPDGNDAADGLSVAQAWKSLARAAQDLRPGDTLYLEGGVHPGTLEVNGAGQPGKVISIRGRGSEPALLQGGLRTTGAAHLEFQRLRFDQAVHVRNGSDLGFENCQFTGPEAGLVAKGVQRLSIQHCVFTGMEQPAVALQECGQADLRGNLYDHRRGAALRLDRAEAVRYANYNGYRDPAAVWEVGGKTQPLSEVQKLHEQESMEIPPVPGGVGPFGRPIGLDHPVERQGKLELTHAPTVHSVSATTANLEWMTSLPAECQLAWGETPACANKAAIEANYFGSYSLQGLKPGATYYFRITALRVPEGLVEELTAASVKLDGAPVAFTTLVKDRPPATWFVAPDGDDANTGLSRGKAWKTIRHAAGVANVGDTVLIAGGTYPERVRIRATGAAGAPITFKCLPGEKVILDGAEKVLNSAFVTSGKSHLRFDGLYFRGFNFFPSQGWRLTRSGEFYLYDGRDIQITRCFSDGRMGYTARSVDAWKIEDLLIRNCVTTNKMSGAYELHLCPNLRIEHSVVARPLTGSFSISRGRGPEATLEKNIFTDHLKKKADLNNTLLYVSAEAGLRMPDNCLFLRSFPPEKRKLIGELAAPQLTEYLIDPLFVDPGFAGAPPMSTEAKSDFSPDRMMDPDLPLDFNSFFATHPEVLKRGIGLQREAFQDFHFGSP